MLFKGSPKERRNFLDVNLSKKYPIYLEYFSKYDNALANRNEMLKSEKMDKKLLQELESSSGNMYLDDLKE